MKRFLRWVNAGPYEAVLLPDPLRSEVVEMLARAEYYPAIKLTRTRTDLSLSTAKRAVDAIVAETGHDARSPALSHSRRKSG